MERVVFDRDLFGPPEIAPEEIKYEKMIQNEKGCYGRMYLGECRGTKVAIKKLFQQNPSPSTLASFKHEIEVASRLCSPNVLLFMGACTSPGEMAIVMEYCAGNLDQLLHKNNGSISLFKKLQIAEEIAAGMCWLHQSDPPIIHRDLKPRNILLDHFGSVRISDFVLSELKKDEKLKTSEGVAGTPLWMSPEVLMGNNADLPSDVYSFALILWEILTQEEVFAGYDNLEKFRKDICINKVRPMIPDTCPIQLKNLMEACWNHHPDQRPSFSQIRAKLRELKINLTISDPFAISFWRSNFQEKSFAPFDSFITAIEREYVDEDVCFDSPLILSPSHCDLLRLLFSTKKKDGIMIPEDIVNIETFSSLIALFGPMDRVFSEKNMLQRIISACSKRNFFGIMNREEAENKLRVLNDGAYLIRFSADFTSIVLSGISTKVFHRRIKYDQKEGVYSLWEYGSAVYQATSLEELICKVKVTLKLGKSVPYSPFASILKPTLTLPNYTPHRGYDNDNS